MKQQRPLTITGGRLVLPGEVRTGALRCVEGRIVGLGAIDPEDGDEIVDAGGKLIAPGLVDFGVFAVDKPAFHFGGKDDLSLEKVNYSGKWDGYNSGGKTKPVKSYPPNQWGLYEMHGNVWEWCQDWYDEPEEIAMETIDPIGPATGVARVLRGGCWFSFGHCVRSAVRDPLGYTARIERNGFRLAL